MMPIRLLFVDDEPMVLDGLRRALHGMRREWQMTFVESASAALTELNTARYDAVITDMTMPYMDGAQLLEEVKKHHQEVVRIVLSGQTSKEALFRSVDPTHQFLSKPCDLEELKRRLNLAFAMRELLSNDALMHVVGKLRSIPSLPLLFNELTVALRSEGASLTQIEQIIAKDVGMAAKILQLANSAFIGARGQVSSLLQAISLIGTEAIRMLTLSVHVFSHFETGSAASTFFPKIWAHSVEVASLARSIAAAERQEKSTIDQSFTAGLLHDIGKAVLLAEMPLEYRRVLDECDRMPLSFASIELQTLGCTHAQVGAYLMSVWGLPAPLVYAVALHDHPKDSNDIEFSPLTAVHCADAIAVAECDSSLLRDVELDTGYIEHLGLFEKVNSWRELHSSQTRAQRVQRVQ